MEEPPNDPKGSGPAYPGTASRRGGGAYTSSQQIPDFTDTPALPSPPSGRTAPKLKEAPVSHKWQPKYLKEQ